MRLAYAVLGLAVLAALLIASEGLLLWVLYYGTEAWRLVPAMGAPLLVLVATVIAVGSYALRSVAAGAIIGVGLRTAWATVWRVAWPEVGVTWLLSLAGRTCSDRSWDRAVVRANDTCSALERGVRRALSEVQRRGQQHGW